MKPSQLLLIILMHLFAVCHAKNEITITGKISGKIPETIDYTLPINGIDFIGFKNSVEPDSSGNFQIKLNTEKACFVELFTHFNSYGVIIAEPGMKYEIFIDTESKDNKFRVISKNEKGLALYNRIPNRSMLIGGHFELETKKYSKDSIVSEIQQKTEKTKELEIDGFKKLLKEKASLKTFTILLKQTGLTFTKA